MENYKLEIKNGLLTTPNRWLAALFAVTCLLAVVFFSLPSPPPIVPSVPTPAPPAPARVPASEKTHPVPAPAAARIGLILDDFGAGWGNVERCLSLHRAVAIAVIPHLPASARVAREAHARGFDVFLHQPMEPHDFPKENPGKYGIYLWQSPEEVAAILRENISSLGVPVGGVNNHMGSRATEHAPLLNAFFDAFPRHTIFLDSRTSTESIAFDVARSRGITALRNNVFLDAAPDRPSIERSFDQLIRIAQKRGFAVAIGHVQIAETIAVLEDRLPRLSDSSVRLVRMRELVDGNS